MHTVHLTNQRRERQASVKDGKINESVEALDGT